MQIGMIGLGRMGASLALRLIRNGHAVVAFDQDASAVSALARDGAAAGRDLADLVKQLAAPRAVWVMLPAGEPTDATITRLGELMSPGDTIIDGGNTFWRDDLRRAKALKARGIHHVDAGTSGGILGREQGYCLMIGGEKAPVERLAPVFAALSPGDGQVAPTAPQGWLHVGPNGAGHFVKMVHNGIEYALMQAYAEGFQILEETASDALPADERFALDTAAIAEVWRHGSIVSSQLLDVIARALDQDTALADFSGVVADTGEGRWTVQTAIERAIPAMALTTALNARFRSRRQPNYADKLISAMRRGFGGHAEPKGKA
ncbi:MAG: phosphogluconate dehydrogenase (NAD(+)-dependent, decarboxylating) [Pseudolabrys sp.]